MNQRLIFTPTQQRFDLLRRVSHVTGLTHAEILRRMIDYAGSEKALNNMFPAVSGQFQVRRESP